MELPFENVGCGKDKDKYESKMNGLKKEKNMNGDEVRGVLIKKIKATEFMFKTEKNYKGVNENPFDLIAGDEKSLDLIGFEIKGDTDNFSRLKTQLQAYLFCFDGVYLVLHKKKEPEWLPEYVGVIRVFNNGDAYIEKHSYFRTWLDISTDYEWDALFRCNGLGISSNKTREVLSSLKKVRRNVLFNRFFAIHSGYGTKKFDKFYPFTEKEKSVLIGFDIPFHYKLITKDLVQLEKRVDILKKIIMAGQKGLKEFK